jgi:hypothetical protein
MANTNTNQTVNLTLEEQRALRIEAGRIIDEVCGSCTIILENRKKLGNKGAYNYCCRECEVGKKLQEIGEKLLASRRKRKKL